MLLKYIHISQKNITCNVQLVHKSFHLKDETSICQVLSTKQQHLIITKLSREANCTPVFSQIHNIIGPTLLDYLF